MKCIPIVLFLVGTLGYGQRSDFYGTGFKKADSIALHFKGASLKNLPALTYNLTANLTTDVEKFRAIYTWVCTNIENDYGAYQKTVKKRKKLSGNKEALTEWNNNFTPKVFKKLVTHRKTACTGYAFLTRELANLADINCKIINGYGRTATLILNENSIPNHSWNAVELNGKWYLCDPTWSAGRIVLEDAGPKFEPDYFDSYFLADPELFIRNHYPLEINSSFLPQPPTFNQFIEGPVIYKEAFVLEVFPLQPAKMKLEAKKNKALSFTLRVPNDIKSETISLAVNKSGSDQTIHPQIVSVKNECTLKYSFEKTGSYDVHIKVDDTYIATYVVRVKKG
ncbi:MAG: transglutaminase domain-containing protein [Maribacter sp.]|uniref:transglutaminase domain-containing protein n=1 Tax=Maribacter sp. TaxID=1897614 RepID=UPI0032982F98